MSRLADAITAAVRAALTTAADWERVTVDAVNGDGTLDVTTADGGTVPQVRHLAAYASPAAGDVVVMHRSSTGNRYVSGPLAGT